MKPISAICVLTNSIPGLTGTIEFIQKTNQLVEIIVNIKGLSPGNHGFHIHEAGDLTQSCASACSHFNPKNKLHGGPMDKERHVGDLGNLKPNKHGNIVNLHLVDNQIKLKGKYSIIGRSVVIHENEDDLGLGGLNKKGEIVDDKTYEESIKTGNAGKRIACGVIGYSSKMYK